ncbi:MAG: DEAD/DEAH box helicase, partial [bacterium]|nr:DEAD/DEAH box helicase [bacterium]
MIRIIISEFSSLDRVKYTIEGESYETDCFDIKGELGNFFPYDSLNPLQTVFYKYYRSQFKNVIISTPTSSGKSGVIYLALEKHFNDQFKGFIYTSPTKALIEEKFREFKSFYGTKNLTVDIKTGDYISKKINPLTNIICTTYDSLAIAMRNQNEWIDKNFIVIDEVHSLVSNLGKFLVEILALSKNYSIPLILLSATLPVLDDLQKYLNPDLVILSNYRPVKINRFSVFLDSKYLRDFNFEIKTNKTNERAILYVLNCALQRAQNINGCWETENSWYFENGTLYVNLGIGINAQSPEVKITFSCDILK